MNVWSFSYPSGFPHMDNGWLIDMIDRQFIQDCIVETLTLDHENLETLVESVMQACIDNSIQYDSEALLIELKKLIKFGKIEPLLYDPKVKNLIAIDFHQDMMDHYWYRLTEP